MPYVPERGDIAWVSFSPQAGHEQAGRKPALVLSPDRYNSMSGLCLVCPITSRAKGYPFEVPLPDGASIEGVVLSDHVRSVDWSARSAEFIERVPESFTRDVLWKVTRLLATER